MEGITQSSNILFDSTNYNSEYYLYKSQELNKQLKKIIDENTSNFRIIEISSSDLTTIIQITKQLPLFPETGNPKIDDIIARFTPKWLKPWYVVHQRKNWKREKSINKNCEFEVWKEWELMIKWIIQKWILNKDQAIINIKNWFSILSIRRYSAIIMEKTRNSILNTFAMQWNK